MSNTDPIRLSILAADNLRQALVGLIGEQPTAEHEARLLGCLAVCGEVLQHAAEHAQATQDAQLARDLHEPMRAHLESYGAAEHHFRALKMPRGTA